MEEVRGQLAVGILAEVLRHAAFLRETGRVDVVSERNRGWVVVRDGRPVHAVCRRPDGSPANGLEALGTMLSWSEGTYAFEVELPGPVRESGSLPADAFLDADDDPRTLSGDAETVLKEARAYSGHRNGRLADVRPRSASLSSATLLQPASQRAGEGAPDEHAGRAAPTVGSGPVPAGERASGGTPVPRSDGFAHEERIARSEAAGAAARSRLRPTSVLTRTDGGDPEARVTVSRGALELWRRLDGARQLSAWSEELGLDLAVLERRAGELLRAGLAAAEPEPVYGPAFVAGLTSALNEIMGPMGEIVVQDALAELDLDPGHIPMDRVDDLASALAVHLHRSDWQLKLRARVSRLRAETMETRTEASP